MEIACLGEPLSCAVYAASLVTRHIQLGDIVAFIGQGFAGQVIQQGLKKGGAEKMIVFDFGRGLWVNGGPNMASRILRHNGTAAIYIGSYRSGRWNS